MAKESAPAGKAAANGPGRGPTGAMRADAQRNRARVLEVATAAFAQEGLSVSIHEIARRAGVGTGTVSRHFPTKESLYEAIVLNRSEGHVRRAKALLADEDPGAAFLSFFSFMVTEGAADRGLSEALLGAGFDIEAVATGDRHDVIGALRELLVRAQRVGAVRPDLEVADVKALIVGCVARERPAGADASVRDHMITVVWEGLQARRS